MLNYLRLQRIGSDLGIDKLGVARAEPLDQKTLTEWLDRGYHGEMSYMKNHRTKRLDPGELLPGASSVISVFVNYHQPEPPPALEGVISKYAQGKDYHLVMKDLLHELAEKLHAATIHGLSRKQKAQMYRVFVDSAPVMEKAWAVAAGIGWQGKHSNIITKEMGSWGFLGEIITTEAFDDYSSPIQDHCGTCTACLDACPTQAIPQPYVVDGSKCISHATIELKPDRAIPELVAADMGDWIFGCDVCQDVCPWNRFAKASQHEEFLPVQIFQAQGVPEFSEMTEDQFKQNFSQTALDRPGLKGMIRNQKVRRQ